MSGPTRGDGNHQFRWFVVDAALAALFTWITVVSLRSAAYVDMYGPVQDWGWALALAPNALLLVRRVVPVTALVLVTSLYLAASATHGDSNAPLAIPFFAYSVAVARPLRTSAWIVGAGAAAMSTATFYGPGEPDPLVIVVWFLLYGVGWAIGASKRSNQFRAQQLTKTIDHLEAHQDEVAAQAIAEERIRIARELHDAVGHAVNVMVLQAGAARLSNDPDKAFAALREVEHLGRTALTDLDHMLGLLEGTADRSPAKGIADIAPMVADLRAAGADIELHAGDTEPVARHTQAAAYRIVQEALTNALKHAPGSHVTVTLSRAGADLHISVVDDGSHGTVSPRTPGGRGIVGMTERAHVAGGRLEAGPLPHGGFGVTASLPADPGHTARAGAAVTDAPS